MAALRWFGLILVVILTAGSLFPAFAGVHVGTIYIGGSYGYYSGPYWRGYYWAGYVPPPFFGGWYGPWYPAPYYAPYPSSYYAAVSAAYAPYAPVYITPQFDKGQVNLQVADKSAQIYLDGAYAGKASMLKTFWLAPGVYHLEVRANGQTVHEKRIYVLTGKTLKIKME
jgi:hypothetical protein